MKSLLFFLFLSIESFAAQRDSALMKQNVFGPGEKFRYKIIYKLKEIWVSAGYVDFEINARKINKKEYWELDVQARTMPAFDLFYKVRDHYISVIDPVTLLPAIFVRDVNEGGYKIHNKYEFNHDSLRVKSETEDSRNPLAEDNYTFLKNTQDLVSCLYYARNINVEGVDSGKVFPINLFLDNKNYKVGLRYLGREKVITDLGEVNCIVGQPLLLEGRVFEETEQMRIYVTDDARRIPIMIESPLKVGKIMAQLIEAK
jgi:hypothetical protein